MTRAAPPSKLIELLADGQFHSGQVLADKLGVTRSAVWKQVRGLAQFGLEVHAVSGRGYRLAQPLSLLDKTGISADLSTVNRARLCQLECLSVTESTNSYLAALAPPAPGKTRVCLADYQSAGRGRQGRRWLTPFGAGLCMSVAWQFARQPAGLSCLSLMCGVVFARALSRLGVDAELKWPNDLLLDGGKLGGILVELRAELGGSVAVVIGLGLNVALSPAVAESIRDSSGLAGALPPASLETALGSAIDRNQLAAILLDELLTALPVFATRGFAPFAADWHAADSLRESDVVVSNGAESFSGRACGIDAEGALLVSGADGERRFVAGEVSLRACNDV